MQLLALARSRVAHVQPLVTGAAGLRWLYHVAASPPPAGDYEAPSLAREGFAHGSYRDAAAESARLYFQGVSPLYVYCIDPRRLRAKVSVADTPRGPMPHVHGPIERDAIRKVVTVDALGGEPDLVRGTRFAFVSFPGMTLLDLVGVYDPISRIGTMGFDEHASFEIVGAFGTGDWSAHGATLRTSRLRPDLGAFDVLVIPGGHGARALARDDEVLAWLGTFPENRLLVTVCTGALVAGSLGRLRGKRATTHHSALPELASFGAIATSERVVDEGQLVTGAGVTSGIDVGLAIVARLMGADVAAKVARQMEMRS